MKITLAEPTGFCFGVRRALNKAGETLEKSRGFSGAEGLVYACGSIIHNRQVTAELAAAGLLTIDRPEQAAEGASIIVRSHGEAEAFFAAAEKRNLKVIDATCPFVSKIHEIVFHASRQGRHIVVVGDPDHPEVIGTIGWVDGDWSIVREAEQAAGIAADCLTVVAQTTIPQYLWDEVVKRLQHEKTDVVAIPTICNATIERQTACRELAARSDCMIVIGDQNSANSNKLFQIAKEVCRKTYFVEKAEDLALKEMSECDRIGVAAGASTPERIIKEVITTMSEQITDKEVMSTEEVQNAANEAAGATEEAGGNEVVTPADDVATDAAAETVAESAPAEQTVAPVVDEGAVEEEKNEMHDFMAEIDRSMRLPNRGEIVEGEIVQVTNREIVVNLGCKKDGIIPKEELVLEGDQELTELFKEGDDIQAKVLKTDDGDGNILLSRKKLEVIEHWEEINESFENKTVVDVKVIREVKGGVIALYKEVSGFIPMSQLSDKYVEKADEFIGKVLPVKVSRVDQRRNKAVFSHKAFLAEEKQQRVKEIWESLEVGNNIEGTVMRFTDYGAFVDIGGIDGLLHISEISWGKLKHPQEALKIGERINVRILSLNSEKGKISLGMKQNQPEPWTVIDQKYEVNQVIEGKVVQIKEYGAFVELEPGLDGLVHISEIAHKRVTNITDEVEIGEIVNVKILDIDKDRRRISLSIKETRDPADEDDRPSKNVAAAATTGDSEDSTIESAETLTDKAEEIIEQAKDQAEALADKAEEIFEQAKDKAEDLAESVGEKTKEIFENLSDKVEDLVEKLSGDDVDEKADTSDADEKADTTAEASAEATEEADDPSADEKE